jgi:hypothetical protein
MKVRVTDLQATARVRDLLHAILSSEEWSLNASLIPASDYMEGREPFRRFFDAYEGSDGEDWIGIMEWAVLEEMRASGSDTVANDDTVIRIVDRFERHPDICLER